MSTAHAIADPQAQAGRAAFVAGSTAELERRVCVHREWLLDIARNPAPHRDAIFVAMLQRGLRWLQEELERRSQPRFARERKRTSIRTALGGRW